MYAIIEESGGQRKVNEGDEILIDLYQGGEADKGGSIEFGKVLLVGDESDAGKASIGKPYKFKAKKGYKRKTGHRQRYTAVKITSIKG